VANEIVLDVSDLAESLAAQFAIGPVETRGQPRMLVEETVARLDGLKMQIFADEHPPPHFRVTYAGETANFTIKDCSRINGRLDKWLKTIQQWHSKNKAELIAAWDRTRPANCPVGKYRE